MSLLADTRFLHQVLETRRLGEHAFVLRFERRDLQFEAGQYLSVGVHGDLNMREYSIYSGIHEPWLEILVREVSNGLVSRRLAQLARGDQLRVEGPFGFFTADPGPLLLVASGSGIAPFHAMVRSNQVLDFTLLHGIRQDSECYDAKDYPGDRYVPCVSRNSTLNFPGRVTQWLREHPAVPEKTATCYLSGNCDMIYEVYDILRQRAIPADRIRAEVYF